MPFTLDRRLLLRGGIFGLAALSTPGMAQILAARGFTHGVASGEPTANSVLLWTRYVGSGETRLQCELSEDDTFRTVAGGGTVIASPVHDNCAKLVVDGLAPGKWYYYRFVAPGGVISDIGRTRTMPVGRVDRFGIGLFSCSNMGFGWFNAYGHAALRDDLDLIIHVGDYLYEYPQGIYPGNPLAGRMIKPVDETITLADYRMRFASYRLDPDLRRLHQNFPMIAQWDDHEIANDAYPDGAENHQSDTEGLWSVRKAAAKKAYREWMPVSQAAYNHFEIGSLATIFRPETRITGRTKQLSLSAAMAGQDDTDKALKAFRDGPWIDSKRTILGEQQEMWLYEGMAASARAGTRWQILAQQVVMGTVQAPQQMADFSATVASPGIRQTLQTFIAASRIGLPLNMDAWDGYPAARERLYRAALDANCNLVVLSGDSHNAWGNNLALNGTPVGVEYACQSVSSPGFEAYLPSIKPKDLASALQQQNPDLAFSDTSRRGYVSLELTPDKINGQWHFNDTVTRRTSQGITNTGRAVKWSERHFQRM